MKAIIGNPQRANRLAMRAEQLFKSGQTMSALSFIERAIEYDQAGILNAEYGILRAEIWLKLGNDRPEQALFHYNRGVDLTEAGDMPEAEAHYLEAFRLDPRFLWPLNNLAWRLATTPITGYCNGARARDYAIVVCRQSFWNYWAFISTLAAAYGSCGLFDKAAYYQQRALALAPVIEHAEIMRQLTCYVEKRAYIAIVDKPVAGSLPDRPSKSTLQ